MLRCDNCGAERARLDSYCRRCGTTLPAVDSSVPAFDGGADFSLLRLPTGLPIPWVPVRPKLWQGLAALAVGTALEILRREMTRRLSAAAGLPAVADPPSSRQLPALVERAQPPARPSPRGEEAVEVTEAIYVRRVRRR